MAALLDLPARAAHQGYASARRTNMYRTFEPTSSSTIRPTRRRPSRTLADMQKPRPMDGWSAATWDMGKTRSRCARLQGVEDKAGSPCCPTTVLASHTTGLFKRAVRRLSVTSR